jgi:hypothetical protein
VAAPLRRRAPRVWLAGCTSNRTRAWVTQQARNLGLDLADEGTRLLTRPRQQVQRLLRRGLRQQRDHERQAAGAAAAGKRNRGAVAQDRSRRMSGLATDRRPPPPRARASRLRRALQPAKAAPLAQPPATARCGAATTCGATADTSRWRDPPTRPPRGPDPRVLPRRRMTETPLLAPFRGGWGRRGGRRRQRQRRSLPPRPARATPSRAAGRRAGLAGDVEVGHRQAPERRRAPGRPPR